MLFMPQGEQEKKLLSSNKKSAKHQIGKNMFFIRVTVVGACVCMCMCGRLTARLQMSMRSTEICKLR